MTYEWKKLDYAYEILEEINKLAEERVDHHKIMEMAKDLKKVNKETIRFMWSKLTVHGMK